MNTDIVAVAPGYFVGLPSFLAYFALSLVFATLFTLGYSRITAHHEFTLIKDGNKAAVPALLGALVGFALPMRAAMAGSMNIVDFAVWAVIAAIAQVLAYYAARAAMPDVSARIPAGDANAGVWLGGVAIVVGLLNSAAMTY